jgi:hypothetical protein
MSDSEKKTSTPKEIPLHEVVLKIMFEANRERPAELTVSQVHRKITDETISESNILDVLKWLVAQKQVECTSGKFYSLDRFELIEQRIRDAKETGKELNLISEDNPLHEVILSEMYDASPNEAAKFTLDEVYWMISDPKVHKSLVGDALKWLLNQGRVEYLAGKYSLDQIELQDQEEAVKKSAKKKKTTKKAKPKKKETPKEKTKIVIPTSKEEKKLPEKKQETKPKEPVVKSTPTAKPEIVEKVEEKKVAQPKVAASEPIPQPTSARWRMPVLVIAVICALYTFYLLFVLNQTVSMSPENSYSEQIKKELALTKSKLNEVSEKGVSSTSDIDYLKEKIDSLQELTQNASEDDQNSQSNEKIHSLLTRLIVSLFLTLILVSVLLFSARNKVISKK